jgi:hypothetical protein
MARMTALEGANLGLRFLLELCTLAALAYAGFLLFIPLAVIFPLAAAILWGQFIAPRARKRLEDPARLALELVYFAAGVIALVATGVIIPAIVLAVADVGHIALMLALKQR